MNFYIKVFICLIINILLMSSSPASAGLDDESGDQFIRITYAHKLTFPENELSYIFQRVHECLFSDLKVNILFVKYDKVSIGIQMRRGEKLQYKNDDCLSIKYASHSSFPEIRISSRNLRKQDYHDFVLMSWIVQEYSKNWRDGLDFGKINYLTEPIKLQNLYSLIINELNVNKILKSNKGIKNSYEKIRQIHNLGLFRTAKPDGTRFPDFKIVDSGGEKFLMLFDSIKGYKAEYVSFCKETSIDKSRERWNKKVATEREIKKPKEKEEGYLFEEFYFPGCYKLKVPSVYIYDPDVIFDWPGFRYDSF